MNKYAVHNNTFEPIKRQPPWEELIRQQIEQTQAELRSRKLLQQQKFQQQQQIYVQPKIATKQILQNRLRMRQTSRHEMAAHLVCLTAGGGVPLFTRKIGDLKTLPFPVIGSLNGVHMFAKSKDVSLLSTLTKDAQIVWQVFHESIMLILVTNQWNIQYNKHLLTSIFDAMVLLVGLEDLMRVKNVERLKKDLRCCYKLIDTILTENEGQHYLFGQITGSVDCLLTPNVQILQNQFEAFVSNLGTMFGCLLVHGHVVVATKKWWTLSRSESSLLSAFITSSSPMSSRDVPVFLPVESPSVPHRLVTFCLLPDVEMCILCGPTPSIAEVEKDIVNHWQSCEEILKQTRSIYPRNFPSNLIVDKNVLGFLLINCESNRCLTSMQNNDNKNISSKRYQEILRLFYKWVSSTLLNCSQSSIFKVYHTRLKHQAVETYLCTKEFKCYFISSESYKLFVLFNQQIPNFSLRSSSKQILEIFLKEKSLNFLT